MIAANAEAFVYDWYGSPPARLELRQRALELFAIDLADHPERYLSASLPGLPIAAGAFKLAVCSHLLFTWAGVFDEVWHLASLIEMVRVADEVRVFPLVHQGEGRQVTLMDSLRARLFTGFGIDSSIDPVPHEFQRGARHMLRLKQG